MPGCSVLNLTQASSTGLTPVSMAVSLLRWGGVFAAFHLLLQDRVGSCGFENVIGKEEFTVGGHHDNLDLVRQALGNDLVDEQWGLVKQRRLALHALGVSGSHEA